MFADAGAIVICSLIAPFERDRQVAKEIHEKAGLEFLEVYVNAPLDVVEKRDPKGLYKKARSGVIKGFTGISAPYEIPENPHITLNTSEESIEDSSLRLMREILKRTRLGSGGVGIVA